MAGSAVKRLQRDLQEVLASQSFLPYVRALPVKDDMFLWHANLAGPPNTDMYDLIVHLEFKFPQTYPKEPPCVRICNETFDHPNVFRNWNPTAYGDFPSWAPGNWICVDILKPFVTEAYTGWSSSYTVFSILVQLQSFLFYGDGSSYTSVSVNQKMKESSRALSCQLCGHKYEHPWPKVRSWALSKVRPTPKKLLSKPLAKPEPQPLVASPLPGKPTPTALRNLRRKQARERKAQESKGKAAKTNGPPTASQPPNHNGQASGKGKEKATDTERHEPAAKAANHASAGKQGAKAAETPPKTPSSEDKEAQTDDEVDSGYFSVLTMNKKQIAAKRARVLAIDTEKLEAHKKQRQLEARKRKQEAKIFRLFDRMPSEITSKILDHLDRRGQARAVQVCKLWDALINYRLISKEVICFHTKLPYTEAILGIGLELVYYPERKQDSGQASKRINQISSPLDLISKHAFFNEGVTKSVWKLECTHWLPLFINNGHAKRAGVRTYTDAIAKVLGRSDFQPWMALEVIPKLMNTMVVQTMNGSLHTSIVALEGYCAFHRLLLHFADSVPGVRGLAEVKVKQFLQSPERRIKRNTNNLGEFLTLLSFTSITWESVRLPFLLECWDRNVKWMLESDPSLLELEPVGTVSKHRLESTMKHSAVSQRLLMFQVYFLTHIARPMGVGLDVVKASYDRRFGRPSEATKVALQEECKKIKAVKTWPEFFTRLGFTTIPPPNKVCDMLRWAVVNSERKGYHVKKDYLARLAEYKEEQAWIAKQALLDPASVEEDKDEAEEQTQDRQVARSGPNRGARDGRRGGRAARRPRREEGEGDWRAPPPRGLPARTLGDFLPDLVD